LAYLQRNLPKLLIEGLEIVEDFEMNIKGNQINVNIEGSSYSDFCDKISGLTHICATFGCPLCSSIACAITRTTGKPILIERTVHSTDGRTLQIFLKILEEQK
jgi:hypothetical protein